MTGLALDLAYRTAVTAGPFARALAEDYTSVAFCLRAGDLDEALETFEASADRLQRFLTFVLLASELLMESHPSFGAVVAEYGRRVLRVTERIEVHLEQDDLVGLTLALEHGLARGLAEYSDHADKVLDALSPQLAAA